MGTITIRRAWAPDLPGVLACQEALARVGLNPEGAARVFRQQLASNQRLYVICDGEDIVGTATLILDHKFIHGGTPAARIEDVAVRTDRQRQGFGSQLVRHLVDEAKCSGVYKVVLNCLADRVAFYEQLGFRPYDAGMRIDLNADV